MLSLIFLRLFLSLAFSQIQALKLYNQGQNTLQFKERAKKFTPKKYLHNDEK